MDVGGWWLVVELHALGVTLLRATLLQHCNINHLTPYRLHSLVIQLQRSRMMNSVDWPAWGEQSQGSEVSFCHLDSRGASEDSTAWSSQSSTSSSSSLQSSSLSCCAALVIITWAGSTFSNPACAGFWQNIVIYVYKKLALVFCQTGCYSHIWKFLSPISFKLCSLNAPDILAFWQHCATQMDPIFCHTTPTLTWILA